MRLLLSALFFYIANHASQSFAQGITMEDIPLTWHNFTKTNSLPEPRVAHIALNTKYEWESELKQKKIIINYNAELTQNKSESKVKTQFLRQSSSAKKIALLNHEKGHYIIALIKQYWLKDTLAMVKLSERNYKQELRALQAHIETKAAALNQAYDQATIHSTNEMQQALWEKRLLETLNTLSGGDKQFPYKVIIQLEIPKKQ